MNIVEANYLKRISNRIKEVTGQMPTDMVDYPVLSSIHKELDRFILLSTKEEN